MQGDIEGHLWCPKDRTVRVELGVSLTSRSSRVYSDRRYFLDTYPPETPVDRGDMLAQHIRRVLNVEYVSVFENGMEARLLYPTDDAVSLIKSIVEFVVDVAIPWTFSRDEQGANWHFQTYDRLLEDSERGPRRAEEFAPEMMPKSSPLTYWGLNIFAVLRNAWASPEAVLPHRIQMKWQAQHNPDWPDVDRVFTNLMSSAVGDCFRFIEWR